MNNLHPLNSAFLLKRLKELELKQWWLAEQVGVTKLTVNRWIHGKVSHIQDDNLKVLAEALSCSVQDLIKSKGDPFFLNYEEKQNTLHYLLSGDFYATMKQSGALNHYDSIIASHLASTKRDEIIAALCLRLTRSSMAQNNIAQIFKWSELAIRYAKSSSYDPNFIQAHIYNSYSLIREGSIAKASAILKSLLGKISSAHRNLYGEAHSILALAERDHGNHDLSIASSSKALAIMGELAPKDIWVYLLRHAQNYFYAEQFETSYALCLEARNSFLKSSPQHPVSLHITGMLLECALALDDDSLISKHKDDVEQSYLITPSYQYVVYWRAIGKYFLKYGAFREAHNFFQKSLSGYEGMRSYQLEILALLGETAKRSGNALHIPSIKN